MDRKLEFGAAFSRVFDLYGTHAARLLTWAAAVQLVISLLVALLLTVVLGGLGMGAAILVFALVGAFAVVASAVLTGAYVVGLTEAERTGTFPAFGDTWDRVKPRLGALIGTSILAGLGIGLGMILLLVPGLVLMTWWAVFAPVVILEGKGGGDALGRSRELVRGNGWTVFGLVVVVLLITQIASGIIGSIVGGILGGQDEFLGMFGSQFVSGTLLTPVSALLAVVMYEALKGNDVGDGQQLPPAHGTGTVTPQQAHEQAPSSTDPNAGPFV